MLYMMIKTDLTHVDSFFRLTDMETPSDATQLLNFHNTAELANI